MQALRGERAQDTAGGKRRAQGAGNMSAAAGVLTLFPSLFRGVAAAVAPAGVAVAAIVAAAAVNPAAAAAGAAAAPC